MEQKILALLLCMILLSGLWVPAMAAGESADARLTRVTQTVKDTLDLDTESYTDFYGDVSEQELGTIWSLNWSGDGTSLRVEALEDGTVVSYWRSDGDDGYLWSRNLPYLPQADAEAAKRAANAFLALVLDEETESVVLDEPSSAGQLNSTVCRFYGHILLNGLPSPLTYSLTVRGSDNVVTSFRRDATAVSYLGGIPSAVPAVQREDAAKTLRDTLELELLYVTDGENHAVLRYVPKNAQMQYVDAQTGKLVSPSDELYRMNGASPAMAEEAASGDTGSMKRALTQTELTGIDKLSGVLDKETLDQKVRAESAYRLEGFALATAEYRLIKQDEEESVVCTLHYAAPEDEDGYADSRIFSVDGRTGAVRDLYSWSPWKKERKAELSLAEAQKAAESFLRRFTPHAAEFALRGTEDHVSEGAPSYGFTLARKVNGVFFPENYCNIQIDCVTGAVTGLNLNYSEKTRFDGATGIVTQTEALDAWMGTYDVTLAYRSAPRELNREVPDEAKLIEIGFTQFRTLLLSYGLEREDYLLGIDAKTGKPVALSAQESSTIAYDDIAGHWAESEIAALAKYRVGYATESFRPDQKLTQWELVALLASTQGMLLDPEQATKEERDSAYNTVFYMGALKRDERDDEAALTRAQLVRCLLDSAGYGPVARLRGIYTCAYQDSGLLSGEALGYAALAQGLGLIVNARYDGEAPATRAAAAVMLCRLMGREA